MKIEKIKIADLIEYENNAKLHPKEQVEQIKNSIIEFGNNDPIAVDENNVIIEGHGRLLALKELGYKEVEAIRLSHMTDEQKKAYILVHNKLNMNTGFDLDILGSELDEITNIDMADFGFEFEEENKDEPSENPYTQKTGTPVYEPKEEEVPDTSELFDDSVTKEKIAKIKESAIPEEIKDFLILASARHTKFNFKKIAEFYCHASKEIQELFEDNALVIVDFDSAIQNGWVKLQTSMEDLMNG